MTKPAAPKKGMRLRIAIAAAATICAVAVAALYHTSEYNFVTRDDGRFYAVTEYRTYLSLLSMAPGGSSDKPGTVTIYTKAGTSCGTAKIPMLWLSKDLKWHDDTAEINMIAEWNLSKRTVRQVQ